MGLGAVVACQEGARLVIVSGGQTGVDRGALDAALALEAPVDGWCPAGRRAEDGILSVRYPLRELRGAGYLQRTLRNVMDSDATLLVDFGRPAVGTGRNLEFCRKYGKPCQIVDAALHEVGAAVALALRFVEQHGIRRLNIGGPRASDEPRAYGYAYAVVEQMLRDLIRTA